MKKQLLKKLFAFIIMILMFSALPQLASAQKNKPCPQGYKQECHYYTCPLCARGTKICFCVPNGNGKAIGYNATSQQSLATNFELEHPSIISIKIYDATGRLIKTFDDIKTSEGEHQIEWNAKDDNGSSVTTGTYLLKLESGDKVETKKLYVTR